MAIHRGYVLVTDDRKAWLLLADRVRLWDTLDLIKTWADETGVSADVLQEMLQRVYDRGYQPSPRHPLYEWRDRLMTRGEDSPPRKLHPAADRALTQIGIGGGRESPLQHADRGQ